MKLKSLIFFLITLTIFYSGYYYYLAENAQNEARSITRDLEKKGIYLTYDSLEVSGFPYRLILTFENPQLSLREGFINLDWRKGDLDVYLQPWNLTHYIFTGSGGTIQFGKSPLNQEAKTLTPESFRASFITAQGTDQRMSLEFINSVYKGGESSLPPLRVGTIGVHAKITDPSAQPLENSDLFEPKIGDLLVSIFDISEQGNTSENNNFSISFAPRGNEIPQFTPVGLGAWRDEGSTVDITDFSLNWKEGIVKGDGSLTLDEELRPLGVISGTYENAEQVMEFLNLTGFISSSQKNSISMGLKTMSSLIERDETAKTPFSISAQEGGLWLGSLKFQNLEPVIK